MNTNRQLSSLPYISKSRFLDGLQCPKLLWSAYNAKQLFPDAGPSLQSKFDQAHEVGALAKRLFPDGVEIETAPSDFEGAIRLTGTALALRRPIFEAAASANGGYARADVLNPVGADEWDLIEVKSTTGLKDVHIPDLAFQKWVFTSAGIKIRRCVLCHIDNRFVRRGEIEPEKFFTLRDVTAEVEAKSRDIAALVGHMRKTIDQTKCPDIHIGKHCNSPFACPLQENCRSFLPAHNVLELYHDTNGRGFDLLKRNVLRLADIPKDYELSDNQKIQQAVAISGGPHIKRTQIEKFLNTLEYPIHFLDFESFSTALPLFDGSWPYQQIPFQFSLHVVREMGAQSEHRKFIAQDQNDPRPEFIRQLKSAIEPVGSIVVFNATFEKGRLKECADALPEYKSWVGAVKKRMVDLLNPFKSFNFYHPDQCGSASMKSVLPALTGTDYSKLEIQEGETASREFLRVTFGNVSELERKRVRNALELYCGRDTEGMIWILNALNGTFRNSPNHSHSLRQLSPNQLGLAFPSARFLTAGTWHPEIEPPFITSQDFSIELSKRTD